MNNRLTILTNLTNFFYVRLSVNKTTSDTSKAAQNPQYWAHLTSKRALRHNGVHIFDIWQHLDIHKWPIFTCSLLNVLRATTACTSSTSQLPKVLQH